MFSDTENLVYMLRRKDGTKAASRRCESTATAKIPTTTLSAALHLKKKKKGFLLLNLLTERKLEGPWRTVLCPGRETSVVCAASL